MFDDTGMIGHVAEIRKSWPEGWFSMPSRGRWVPPDGNHTYDKINKPALPIPAPAPPTLMIGVAALISVAGAHIEISGA